MNQELLRLVLSFDDAGAEDMLEEHRALCTEMRRRAGSRPWPGDFSREERLSFALALPRPQTLH